MTFNQRTRQNGKVSAQIKCQQEIKDFMIKLSQTVEYESGSLFLLENETQSLVEVASKGDGIDFISSVGFPLGKGLSAWVAQKGRMIYLPDIHRGSRHGLNPVRSYLSLPLEVNNTIIGVLNLGHIVPHAFGAGKLNKIREISSDISREIYNKIYIDYSFNA